MNLSRGNTDTLVSPLLESLSTIKFLRLAALVRRTLTYYNFHLLGKRTEFV